MSVVIGRLRFILFVSVVQFVALAVTIMIDAIKEIVSCPAYFAVKWFPSGTLVI